MPTLFRLGDFEPMLMFSALKAWFAVVPFGFNTITSEHVVKNSLVKVVFPGLVNCPAAVLGVMS